MPNDYPTIEDMKYIVREFEESTFALSKQNAMCLNSQTMSVLKEAIPTVKTENPKPLAGVPLTVSPEIPEDEVWIGAWKFNHELQNYEFVPYKITNIKTGRTRFAA